LRQLRELFSDTIIYGISTVVARFVNYLLVPFYTDVFSRAQYGVVSLVYAAIAFLNVVFTIGMESAYIRYAKDREESRNIFKTLQIALFAVSTILVGVLWMAEPWITPLLELDQDTTGIFLMMLGILWFDTLGIVPFAELRLIRRSILFAILRSGHVAINLALNFYLILGLGFGIEAVFLSNLIASVLTTFAIWLFTLPMMNGSWSSEWMNKAFQFGWPFVPAGIGFVINEMFDRFFLKGMDPDTVIQLYGADITVLEVVGVYSACYKLAVFMLLLVQMFRMAWHPFFMRHSDTPEALQVFAKVFGWFNLAAAAIYITVSLFTQEIVSIRVPILDATLIDSEYWMGLHIVPWLLLAYWFHGWYLNFTAGIFIRNKTKALPVVTLIGAVITIVGNIVLIPYLGMMGSAVATLMSYSVMAMLLYRVSTSVLAVPYQFGRELLFMGVMVTLVHTNELLVLLFSADVFVSKVFLMIAGLLIIAIRAKNMLPETKKALR
jgi:O-antigen/teichoic acid export membrane protein